MNVKITGYGDALYTGGTTSGQHALGSGYGSCANVSCHSSGQNETDGTLTPPLGTGTPTWGAKLDCGSCHKNMNSSASASGSHTKHAQGAINYSCATCHDGYTESSTGATHADGTVNVKFYNDVVALYTGGTTSGQHALGSGYGTCPNVSCHSSGQNETDGTLTPPLGIGTPTWGTKLDCSGCHKNMDSSASASGSHTKHAQGALNYNCSICHSGYSESSTGATHNDGTVNVKITGYGDALYTGGTTSGQHALGSGYGSCATVSCHGVAQNETDGTTALPHATGTPTWGAKLDCGGCHKNMDSSAAASGSHTKHAQGSLNYGCAVCHSGYSETVTGATHNDGTINVKVTGYGDALYTGGTTSGSNGIGSGYGSCATVSCHGVAQNETDGTTALPHATGTPTWGAKLDCGGCHKNMDSSAAASGSHTKHAQGSLNYGCAVCHSGYSETVTGATHNDGTINVKVTGYGDALYTGGTTSGSNGIGSGYGSCATVSCHGVAQNETDGTTALPHATGTPTWGAKLDCGGCHKNMDSSAAASGSHTKHAQGSLNYGCAVCHSGYSETVTGATHNDGTINVKVTGYGDALYTGGTTSGSNGIGSGYGSCATVSCHGVAQNETDGTTALPHATGTPTWGAKLDCGGCHKNMDSSAAASGSHTKHAQGSLNYGCAVCHSGYSETVTGATHNDGTINVKVTGYGDALYTGGTTSGSNGIGSGYGSCATVSCHGVAQNETDGTTALPHATGTPTWGAKLDCGGCHKNMDSSAAASGSHTKHAQGSLNYGCAVCHSGYSETVTGATHNDGTINVKVTGYGDALYTGGTTSGSNGIGSGYGSCATVILPRLCPERNGRHQLFRMPPAPRPGARSSIAAAAIRTWIPARRQAAATTKHLNSPSLNRLR